MNASITDIALVILPGDINSYSCMHVVISQADINSHRVNKQEKYRTQFLLIFLIIKTPCSGRHATVYRPTVPAAVLVFKVI